MADHRAIYSVGSSLASFLQNSYPLDRDRYPACQFKLISSGEMASVHEDTFDKTVTIFLHRITVNEFLRNATRLTDSTSKRPLLNLDLHYLLTYWGRSAEDEELVLAWTMSQLQLRSILDRSILSTAAGWDAEETVQIAWSNLSIEDIMRVWDALAPKYRLSIAYTAQAVRIDVDLEGELPAVAARLIYETKR